MYKKVPTKTKKCILGSLQEVKVTGYISTVYF